MTNQCNLKIVVSLSGAPDMLRLIFRGGSGCGGTSVFIDQILNLNETINM